MSRFDRPLAKTNVVVMPISPNPPAEARARARTRDGEGLVDIPETSGILPFSKALSHKSP
jgi:hypothetical protein